MKAQQKNKEQHFHWRRLRYGVAGKDVTGRLKRRGFGVHRARGAMARVIEWLCICLRHGWLGNHKTRNTRDVLKRDGVRSLRTTLRARLRHGAEIPYGPAAVALGLAPPPAPPPPASP